ncbi:uncharacterized protein LOC131252673 [Magnolia sinica]|uniref:uncharacterized protein LOC131252673 n=1 Tax=Magnolia sinica TaxID=86752 RepID=UPI002657F2F5|nr:uncharacterized protein LOC131252673 [Magnolia sinica]
MGKPSKAKKPENVGTGKITPIQVAFIVDRYLSDNNYTKTLSVFRTEASSLISATKVREAPKSLLSLGAILDEYICLKEQKVILDKEKCRVEKLLQGMQDVMHAYNSAGSVAPISTAAMTPIPQIGLRNGSHGGYPIYNTPTVNPVPMLPSPAMDCTNFSTPVTNLPSANKRKGSRLVSDAIPTSKKSCTKLPIKAPGSCGTEMPPQATNTNADQEAVRPISIIHSTSNNHPPRVSSVQGSSVAKSLFKQTQSQADSSWPKTPPQDSASQADKSVSPLESSSANSNTPQKKSHIPQRFASADCHIITSERVVVSPFKYTGCYTMDRSLRVSSSPLKSTPKRSGRRDHIKGRLDFDDSNVVMGAEKPVAEDISTSSAVDDIAEMFDMDIPNFDVFGSDFSLSELLVDFDLDNEGMGLAPHQAMDPSIDLIGGPDHESGNGGSPTDQASSEPPLSSITTILSEKDMNRQGMDSMISVKSITKCIKIVSPAKSRRSSSSK